MNYQESFPVFDLQLDCDFESSDEKFTYQRKQNNTQTQIIEDGNVTVLSTIGKRNANLDTFSYLVKDSWTLMGVYDGHGDDKVAKYLKQNLLQRLCEHKQFKHNTQHAIRQGNFFIKIVLQQIEEQVLQMFQKGSTVLISIIKENEIITANIGDSKMFGITKNDNKLIPMTKQHNLSNQNQLSLIMSKGGLIFKRGNQYRINGQLNISRTIGDKKHKLYMSSQPDIYKFEKGQYKKIILATDGFYKHQLFHNQLCKRSVKEIENKIRKGILGYGFDDNATILSYKIKNSSSQSTSQEFFTINNSISTK